MAKGVISEEGDLGGFAPGGDPKKLGQAGGADSGGMGGYPAQDPAASAEGSLSPDASLAKFAGIRKSSKLSHLEADAERIAVPSEGQQSLANRKT